MDSKFGDSNCLEKEFPQQDNSIESSVSRSSSLLDFLNYSDCINRVGGEPAISSFTEASASVSSEHVFHKRNLRKQWIAFVTILSFCLMVIAIALVMAFLTKGEVSTYLHMNVLNVRYHPAMKNETSKQFKEISVPFCHEMNRYMKSSYLSEIQQGCTLQNITKSHSYIRLNVLLDFKNSNKLSSPDQVRDIIISKSNLQPVGQTIYIKIHHFLIPYKSLRVHFITAVSSAAAFFVKETDNQQDFAVPKGIDLNTTRDYRLHFNTDQNVTSQTNPVTLANTETITEVNTMTNIIHGSVKRQENLANFSVYEREIPIIGSVTKQPNTKTAIKNGKLLFVNKTSAPHSGNKTKLFIKKTLFNNTSTSTSWFSRPIYSLRATMIPGWRSASGVWGAITSKSFDRRNSNELSNVLNSPNNKTLVVKSSDAFANRTRNISEDITYLDVDKGHNNQSETTEGNLSITTSIPHRENNTNSQTKQRNSSHGSINVKTGIGIKPSGSGWLAIPFQYLTRGSSQNKSNSSNSNRMNGKRKRQKTSKELPVKVGVINSSKTVTVQNYMSTTSLNKDNPLHGSDNLVAITNNPFDFSEKDNVVESSTTSFKTELSFKNDTTHKSSSQDYVEKEQQNSNSDIKNIPVVTHSQTTVTDVLSNIIDGDKNSTLKLLADASDKTSIRISHLGSSPNITRSLLETEQTRILGRSSQDEPNAITPNSVSTTISYEDVKFPRTNFPTHLLPILSTAVTSTSNDRSRVTGVEKGSLTPNHTHMRNVRFKPTDESHFMKEVSITPLINKYLKKIDHNVVTSNKSSPNRDQQYVMLQTSTQEKGQQRVILQKATTNRNQQDVITLQSSTTNRKLQGVAISELNRNRDQQSIITSQKPTTNSNQKDVGIPQSNRDRAQQSVARTQSTRNREQQSVVSSHKFTIDKSQQRVVAPQKSIIDRSRQDVTLQAHTVTVITPYHTAYNTIEPPPTQHTENIVYPTIYITDSNNDTTVWHQGLNLLKNTKVDNKNLSIKADLQLDSSIKKEHPTASEEETGVTVFMSAGFGWVKIPINKTLPEFNNVEGDTHNTFTKKSYKNPIKLSTIAKSMKGSLLASIIPNITNKLTTNQSVNVTDTKPLNSFHPMQNPIVTRSNVLQTTGITESSDATLNAIESLDSNILASLTPEEVLVTSKTAKKNVTYMTNGNTSTVNSIEINVNTNYSWTTNTLNALTAFTPQESQFTLNIFQRKGQRYVPTESSSRLISTQIKQMFGHLQNTSTFEQNKSLTRMLNVTSDLHKSNSKWSQNLTNIQPLDFSVPQFPSNTTHTTQDMTTTSNQFISSPEFISGQLRFTNSSSSSHKTVSVASPKPYTWPFKTGFATLNPPHMGSTPSSDQSIMKSKVTPAHFTASMSAVKTTTPITTTLTTTFSTKGTTGK